jgi:hypothetical protein
MDTRFTRRKLLTSTVTVAGVGLAGCTAGGDGTPSGERTGTPTGAASKTPTPGRQSAPVDYREWLPRPGGSGAGYYFNGYDYARLRANEDRLDRSVYEGYVERDLFDTLGLDVADLTYGIRVFTFPPTPSLLLGQFSQSAIVDRLQSLDYAVAEERETYNIYQAPDEGRFVGAKDGVVAISDSESESVVRHLTTPDAEEGGYVAASDDLAWVLDAVGYGTFLFGGTNEPVDESDADPTGGYFAGQVAHAYADRVTGATTQSTFAYRFEDADAAAEADLGTYLNGEALQEYDDFTVNTEGRDVVAESQADTDALYT